MRINYKGFSIVDPAPTGTGGDWIQDNIITTADTFEDVDEQLETISDNQTDLTNTVNTISGDLTDLTTVVDAMNTVVGGHTTSISTINGTLSGYGTVVTRNTGTSENNVPVLGTGGKLNSAVLPNIAITDTFVVASQAAMLALSAETGDVAVRTDQNKSYILSTNSPTTLADWKELLTPTDSVLSVDGRTGAVTLDDLYADIAKEHDALTVSAGGSTNGLSLSGQQLTLAAATNASAGAATATQIKALEAYVIPMGGPFSGIKGGTYSTHTITSAGSETTTVYTVPVSTKAIMIGAYLVNDNGSSRTVQLFFRRAGSDWALDNSQNINANEMANFGGNLYPILNASDSIKATISGSDVHVTIHVLEFADSAPVNDFFITTLASTGTAYTCPANKRAIVLGNAWAVQNQGQVRIYNATGGDIDVKIYHVPSGQAKHNKYLVGIQNNISNSNGSNVNGAMFLSEGDTIQYDSDTTGNGYIYGSVVEIGE